MTIAKTRKRTPAQIASEKKYEGTKQRKAKRKEYNAKEIKETAEIRDKYLKLGYGSYKATLLKCLAIVESVRALDMDKAAVEAGVR
jgi:hypothetical protein